MPLLIWASNQFCICFHKEEIDQLMKARKKSIEETNWCVAVAKIVAKGLERKLGDTML